MHLYQITVMTQIKLNFVTLHHLFLFTVCQKITSLKGLRT